jgi:hypothetical protein
MTPADNYSDKENLQKDSSENNTSQKPSCLKRLGVILLYFIGIAVTLVILVNLMTSAACTDQGQCNHKDQIIYAIVGVFSFVAVPVFFILGMLSKLPGTKR